MGHLTHTIFCCNIEHISTVLFRSGYSVYHNIFVMLCSVVCCVTHELVIHSRVLIGITK